MLTSHQNRRYNIIKQVLGMATSTRYGLPSVTLRSQICLSRVLSLRGLFI